MQTYNNFFLILFDNYKIKKMLLFYIKIKMKDDLCTIIYFLIKFAYLNKYNVSSIIYKTLLQFYPSYSQIKGP